MQSSDFTFTDHAGVEIFVYKWTPDAGKTPKGVVQIFHGVGEHAKRYEHFAKTLTDNDFVVYANDHRGHGKTAGSLDNVGQINPDGWEGCLKDLKQLNDIIKKENEGLPIFVFGHSWGSMLGQNFIQDYGEQLKGVILSGTWGKQAMLGPLILISKIIIKFKGPNVVTPLFGKLSLEPLNKEFAPNRTTHDWLSRDENVVDEYIADPYCGFDMQNHYWYEFATAMKNIWKPENEAKIPKDLPILLITGSEDPVNVQTKTFMTLYERYKDIGIKDIEYKIYEGSRHESLNDFDKEKVKKDVVDWLNSHL